MNAFHDYAGAFSCNVIGVKISFISLFFLPALRHSILHQGVYRHVPDGFSDVIKLKIPSCPGFQFNDDIT